MNQYLSLAPQLLRVQAEAIIQAAERLDQRDFALAVEVLSACEGKVVVTGAGTSGVIARKIAATLTSTGTAAVFLHPSDALHGGLGIVSGDDVAIAISNSGETDELLVLVPYLQHRKVPIIGILGNPDSTLGRHSRVVLDAYASRESCPLNLAPTASTSVALALGDVLAMTVMQVKNVTPEGFALNHPSGTLGRRLTLKVDNLIHADHRAVRGDAPWLEVVSAITESGLGAVTVEDDDSRLVGIVTDGDLRRTVQQAAGEQLQSLRASDVMTAQPVSIELGVLAYDALQLMENRQSQISVLPVVDTLHHCVGVVRLHDLVRAGI